MTTTVEQGNAFAQQVSQLLSYAGYQIVGESLEGHKKADLVAEHVRFGIRRDRVAVECKTYASALSKDTLTQIYADYLPLVQNGIVDEILLVTQKGLTAAGNTYVKSARNLIHVTFDELLNSVIDFRQYLQHQIRTYETEPVSRYYVPLATDDADDLEERVLGWIDDPKPRRPLAILGSYGLGKTTFATHLAAKLAGQALQDRTARIPILIRLADLSAEQSLEGLLGKTLTANALVVNYSLPTFLMLNDSGRLVILLDGFDEMKHTLSWEVVRHNFAQLNRLVKPQSRVILLGRPTAFLSDEEQQMALHGLRRFGDQTLHDPQWPDYEEIELAPFSRAQVETFLAAYFRYRKEEMTASRAWLPASKSREQQNELKRIDELARGGAQVIATKQLADIARRPVQLRMLAEILPQWRGDVSSLTTALLYSEFIKLVIEREVGKHSRLRFGEQVRRGFARNLAWWMWTAMPSGRRISGESLPSELFTPYMNDDDDEAEVRRDLVAACFLERKLGGTLYWPHRSFQEFLVAEEIVARLDRGETSFEVLNKCVTDEVSDFVSGLIGRDNLLRWDPALVRYRGRLAWRVAKPWISEVRFGEYLAGRLEKYVTPWHLLLTALFFARRSDMDQRVHEFQELLIERISADTAQLEQADFTGDREETARYIALCLLASILVRRDRADGVIRALESVLTTAPKKHSTKDVAYARNECAREVAAKIAVSKRKGTLDLGGLYPWMNDRLGDWCMISEWVKGETIVAPDLNLPQKLSSQRLAALEEAIAEVRQLSEPDGR